MFQKNGLDIIFALLESKNNIRFCHVIYQDTQRCHAFWLVLSNKKPPKSIPLGVLVCLPFLRPGGAEVPVQGVPMIEGLRVPWMERWRSVVFFK